LLPDRLRPGLDLDACIFGACRLTLQDFVHAVKNEPRTAGLVRLATLLGALACPIGLWLLSTSAYRSGWGLLAFGMSCFAAHGAPEHIAQRWFAKTPEQARNPRYTLTPQGLIVVSELSRQQYAWPELYGFQIVPEALLVWVSARLFLIIPKRAFSPDALPRVIDQLERQVGAPPPLPRFWSWLFLAIALTALALWLWNRLNPR
jgi:YcxB-like protein